MESRRCFEQHSHTHKKAYVEYMRSAMMTVKLIIELVLVIVPCTAVLVYLFDVEALGLMGGLGRALDNERAKAPESNQKELNEE